MLSSNAALRKDKVNAKSELQHRHFATIASIIADIDINIINPDKRDAIARHFATQLADTNPRFDRERFLRACGVEQNQGQRNLGRAMKHFLRK